MMTECNLCGNENTFNFLYGISDSSETVVKECKNCGVQFLHPMMSLEEEEEYYKDYYLSQAKRYISAVSLNKVQQNSFLYHLEHIDNYKEVKNGKKILEIGSGAGGFLKLLSKSFPDKRIFSIERSEVNLNFLKKQFLQYSFYKSIDEIKEVNFDCILGIALLEHIRNPIILLKKLKEILIDDGTIFFEIPNKSGPLILCMLLKNIKYSIIKNSIILLIVNRH